MGNSAVSSGWLFDEVSNSELKSNSSARLKRIGLARFGAEAASLVAAGGGMAILSWAFPKALQSLEHSIASHIIYPNLDLCGQFAGYLPALEGDEGIKEREQLDRKGQAQYFAESAVNFTIPSILSFVGQGVTQNFLDKKFGLPELGKTEMSKFKKLAISTAVDRAVQAGSFIVINSPGPGQNANAVMQKGLTSMISNLPMCDDQFAKAASRWLVNWTLPGAMGALASVHSLDKAYSSRLTDILSKSSGRA